MRRVYGFFFYSPEKTCPRCGSTHVHRTKRGRILEFWVLLFLPVRPYRCGKCRLRFYGPKRFPDYANLADGEAAAATVADGKSSAPPSESSEPSRK